MDCDKTTDPSLGAKTKRAEIKPEKGGREKPIFGNGILRKRLLPRL